METQLIPDLLSRVISWQEEESFLESYTYDLPSYFGKIGRHNREDWEAMDTIIEDARELNSLILDYAADLQQAAFIKESLGRRMSQGIYSFRSMYGAGLQSLKDLLDIFIREDNRLYALWQTDRTFMYPDTGQWIDTAILRLSNWLKSADKLKDWYQWLVVSRRMDELNVGFFASAYFQKPLETGELMDVFRKSYRKACIRYIFNKNPQLELFN
ncbi:MAG: hypothetical protein LIP01_00435, partial [Tannerellaceae bacterium]|nr:hypothetical protein [Tannerellaceae bacterium]